MTAKAKPAKRKSKEDEVDERTAPPGDVVYEAIYREGEHELTRDTQALWWSGLAAGLSVGFSMICEALLHAHLPEAHWTPLISKFGYSVGFLIVILGRQQLFTKNTLTVILPLLREKTWSVLGNVGRLWSVVLLANLAGAFSAAWLLGNVSILDDETRDSLTELGREATESGFGTLIWRGVLAGWFIALMVWLLPFAESSRIWVIIILAYFLWLGHLPHIVAGGAKAFFLVGTGELPIWQALTGFLAPTFVGNVIGGVSLVAALAHAEFVAGESGEDV